MARKPDPDSSARTGRSPSGPADSKRAPSLASLRAEIDRLDRELVKLLNHRAEIAAKIGQVKERQGVEVWSPAREEDVLEKALAASRGPLPEQTMRLIFRELMSGSRSIQRTLRVASLGPRYSYSHLAAVAKFGSAVEHVPLGTIGAVFEEVTRGTVEFGLVPLENSTDGRIADTLEMFTKVPRLKIRAEVRLRIHHCLMARCEWGLVQRVYSKAQAISQCRHWLSKNMPNVRLVDVVSTAAAAEHAAREEYAAAIASRPAASAYGLNVIAPNIEDRTDNVTRFAVIAHKAEGRTGKDKTSLLMRLPHRAGSLARALAAFEKAGLNLTMIESFPTADGTTNGDPHYIFFVDLEGHADDPVVAKALEAARRKCERLEVLGSYPRADCVES